MAGVGRRAAARARACSASGGRSGRASARRPSPRARPDGPAARTSCAQAGFASVTPAEPARRACLRRRSLVFVLVAGDARGSLPVALCFGADGRLRAVRPGADARSRAPRRACATCGPTSSTTSRSAVRAGLALPEALSQLGVRGPEELRPAFAAFAEDYRATGRFQECLDRLKDRLADPVGDRLVESLRIAREVGGSDLGRLLRTLSTFLREDARTRAELETRQGWTVNAARLAVAAPWVVLALLCTRPDSVAGLQPPRRHRWSWRRRGAVSVVAYRVMVRIGRLPEESGCCDEPARWRRRAARSVGLPGAALGAVCSCVVVAAALPAAAAGSGRARWRRTCATRPRPAGCSPRGRTRTRPGLRAARSRPCCATSAAGSSACSAVRRRSRRRLQRAGLPPDVERFRAEQVVWGVVAGLVGHRRRRRCCGWPRSAAPWCRWCCSSLCAAGGGIVGPRPAADAEPPTRARAAHAGRVPHHRRAAGPRRRRRRGRDRRARTGLPALPAASCPASCGAASPTPAPAPTCRPRCRASPTGPACPAWRGSSTASSSRSSAAPRWPRCCAPRPQDVREAGRRAVMEAGRQEGDRDDGPGRVPRAAGHRPVRRLSRASPSCGSRSEPSTRTTPVSVAIRRGTTLTIIRSLTASVLTVTYAPAGGQCAPARRPGARRRAGVGADHLDDRRSRDRAVGTGRAAAERRLHRRHQLGQRTLTGVCGLWTPTALRQ